MEYDRESATAISQAVWVATANFQKAQKAEAEDAEKSKVRKKVEDEEAKARAEREAADAARREDTEQSTGRNVIVMDKNGRMNLTSRDKIRRIPNGAAEQNRAHSSEEDEAPQAEAPDTEDIEDKESSGEN